MSTTKTNDNSNMNLLAVKDDAVNSVDNVALNSDGVTEVDEDTTCGIGSFRPQWIQSWATPKIFLLFFSITGVLQGMLFPYRIGVLSTMEKRYAYDSRVSGSILMVEEVTPVFLGALLGYFGSKGHRSRILAAGMFASVLCSFICTLPYFIYGPASEFSSLAIENKTTEDMCVIESKTDTCSDEGKPAKLPVVLIFTLASVFQGFGTIAFHAIGVPFLDDIAKKRDVPLYLAVTHAVRVLGSVFGFLLSSFCLKYYESPVDDPGFGPEDPRWIGAWWLGFLVQGTLLFIFTIPFLLFPKELPGKKRAKEDNAETQSLKEHLIGFLYALKRLGTNVLCICLWLNTVISVYGGVGHLMLLPRYMEQQFRLSAADASLYSNPLGLTALILSQLGGGFFIWKFQPKVKSIIIGIISLEFAACIGCLLLMIPRCDKIDLYNSGYNAEGLILENECNLNCNCTLKSFAPVCGPDGKTTYFSPCFAGCKESFSEKENEKVFTNCSCIIDFSEEANNSVTEGYCYEDKCWSQALIYIGSLPVLQILVNFLKVGYTMLLLRSIAPEDKSVCVGTFEMLLCLFAYIPYPVVSGALLDSACIIFEKSCGTTGNCWFYDVDKFNYLIHGLSGFFVAVGMIWFFGIYFYRDRLYAFYEDDDDDDPDDKMDSNMKNTGGINLTEM